MFVLVTVLIIIVALLLALVVLVQNGKGGGLAANFASQNQVMGVRKTTDFLEKATWTLAAVMILLCLISSALTPKTVAQVKEYYKGSLYQITENATLYRVFL